jgi:hypothetical protein
MRHPAAWSNGAAQSVSPRTAGTASTTVDVPTGGTWEIWLGGSVKGRMRVSVDGRPAGSVRHFLNNLGLYVQLGSADLQPGAHTLELHYGGTDLHPGSGGRVPPIGPLILSSGDASTAPVSLIPAARARELCGKRLDWVESIPG